MTNKINCVLLVDDDPINNFLNKRLIEKLEISKEVKIAANGTEAIKLLEELCKHEEKCPDLILLDINMPVMNGFEFLEEYKKLSFINKPKVVIVMLTTSSNPLDVEKAKKHDISGFLNKPLLEQKIMEILNKYFP